ncbi:transglutaminase-like cysteine peptidase [Rhodocyclus tenuis]|uniref:Putative transglutaminase-like cysteine proteinase n=1 Tax=Rhodocyclus tenuis TaxID=1066 RepID=A0A840GAR9_RHOTE|nr:transglutaminase-like cysteine peptidase [Rhodocyclus tenuis]MBB4248946.1 putative transglutaminase-like cysteine proteinase [Rhodocyclus tenuis]
MLHKFARQTLRSLALAGGLTLVCLVTAEEGFVLERVLQAVQQRHGSKGVAVVRDWNHVLEVFRSGSEQQKLRDINEYFNRKLRFEDDQKLWNQPDYWATPIEALLRGAGDCEDFAIAKYFSLKFVGVPVSKLRITYVRARIGGPDSSLLQAHMVLTYYATPDAEPLVLDNLVSEIRPASRRPDLLPIFSFNSEGVFVPGSSLPQQGNGSRLSRWNDLVLKMQAEGID